MLDKEEYSRIIEESLIRKGFLPKHSFEEKLDSIIKDSFDNLPLLLKKKQTSSLEDIKESNEEEVVESEKCSLSSRYDSLVSNLNKLTDSYANFKEINKTVDDWYMGLVNTKYPGYTKEPFNFKNSMDVTEISIDNDLDFINDYINEKQLDNLKNLRTISDNDLNDLQWAFNRDYAMGQMLFNSEEFFHELTVPNTPESTVMKYIDWVFEKFPDSFPKGFNNEILSSLEDCGKKADRFKNSRDNCRDMINKEVDKRVKYLETHPDEKYYIE